MRDRRTANHNVLHLLYAPDREPILQAKHILYLHHHELHPQRDGANRSCYGNNGNMKELVPVAQGTAHCSDGPLVRHTLISCHLSRFSPWFGSLSAITFHVLCFIPLESIMAPAPDTWNWYLQGFLQGFIVKAAALTTHAPSPYWCVIVVKNWFL